MEHGSSSTKRYLLVFVGLAILTGATVLLSYLGLPHHVGIALAVLIALTKCALIAAFFMHLKFDSRSLTFILLSALFFVAILVLAILPDIGLQ
ncbi:MAG: cytochrome C oxidase subunit IV family protein [Elusimicrobiota bacterium]